MSLLRLLTAGRSLVGLKGTEKAYRVGIKGALPKFERKANPFRVTTRPEAAVPPQHAAGVEQRKDEDQRLTLELDPAIAPMKQTQLLPAGQVLPRAESETVKPCPRLGENPGWFKRTLASVRKPFAARQPQTASGSKPRALVQPELSLDAVKVLRNDLSDSDLEVVMKNAAAESASRFKRAGQVAARPVTSVKTRLFGASRS